MRKETQETVTRKHKITLTWAEFVEKLGVPGNSTVSTYVPGCGWGAGTEEEYAELSRTDVTIEWTETETKSPSER